MKPVVLCFLLTAGTAVVSAQSPGGVGGPELWFQTRPVSSDLNGAYRWVDFSGDSLKLNVYDDRGAAFGEEFSSSSVRHYNGHAALELSGLADLKSREAGLKRAGLSQATIIGAFAPNANFDVNKLLYALNGRPGQGIRLGTDKVYPSRESGKEAFDYGETEGTDLRYSANDAETDAGSFRESSFRIVSYYRSLPPAAGLWGERDRAVLTFNTVDLPGNVNHNSSFAVPLSENRRFTGYIPEIVVYGRLLSPLERRKAESYLAVKYGLSLPVSYLGSGGQLLWDNAANPGYNHRVTALYRDDASGLTRRESATSHEENPRYGYLAVNDYYFAGDPNARSSSSRLLVAGREDGNGLSDGEYLFWGDDGGSVNPGGEGEPQRMQRRWLVKTNIVSAPQNAAWNVENLSFDTKGFVSSVVKQGGVSADRGTAVTAVPLTGPTGYLGIGNYLITGGLTLRFGTQTAGYSSDSQNYGYFIDSDFRIYKIERGVKSAGSFAVLIPGSTIEAEKTEEGLSLRLSGIRLTESKIAVAPEDRGKAFYGAIAVARGLTDAGFSLRSGGFSDTGFRVELSLACAPGFIASGEKKSILMIDRSGTGAFNESDTEYVPVSETDILRGKAVFRNVFFDRDGNGTDVFSFAYGEFEPGEDLQIVPPACGQSDGQFTLNTDRGIRGFDYVLKDSSGASVRNGWVPVRTINVTGLPFGSYELTVAEAGGYTFETSASSGGLLRAKTTNFLPAIDGNIAWRISSLTDTHTVGYTASSAAVGSTENVFHYGLKKAGDKLYKVENGKETPINTPVRTGDEMKIVKGLMSISYYKNGSSVGMSMIRAQDYGLSFHGLIDFGSGPTELLNANAEGFFNLIDYRWGTTDGVTAARATGASKKYAIQIPSGCGTVSADPIVSPEGSGAGLTVSVVPGTRTLHVRLDLDAPSAVSLAVYDLKGTPVAREELAAAQTQTAEPGVPGPGVYVVKAFAEDGREYGRKVIVQ